VEQTVIRGLWAILVEALDNEATTEESNRDLGETCSDSRAVGEMNHLRQFEKACLGR